MSKKGRVLGGRYDKMIADHLDLTLEEYFKKIDSMSNDEYHSFIDSVTNDMLREFSKSKIYKWTKRVLVVILCFTIGFAISFILSPEKYIPSTIDSKYTYLLETPKNNEFSVDSLISIIDQLNLDHKDIVLAQAKLESGNFNSSLFKRTNNLFGMKVPTIRNNLSNGSINGYQSYDSWRHSVIDYALYQATYLHGKTKEEYLEYLKRNYAKDPKYIDKLKELIE